MEVFFEKNIVNDKIEKHQSRTNVLTAVKYTMAGLIFLAIFFVLSFQVIPADKGTGAIVISLLISALLISLPIVAYFVLSRIINKLNTEYDYYLRGTVFRIIGVYNRKRRKKVVEFPIDTISSIGTIASEAYDKFMADRNVKKITAYCSDENLCYIYSTYDGEKRMILVEMDADFLFSLKKTLNMSIFDDSIKPILKAAMNHGISR